MKFTYSKYDFFIGTSKALSLIFGVIAFIGVFWTAFDLYPVIMAITFLTSALFPDRTYNTKHVKLMFYALSIIAIIMNLSYTFNEIKNGLPAIVVLVSGRSLMTLVLFSYLWRIYRATEVENLEQITPSIVK